MSADDRESRFDALIRESYKRLFAYVYAIVRSYPDAEDVVQQASLVLWQKFDDYRADTDFFAWACRVAQLESLHFLRHERRQRAHFSEIFQVRLAAAMASMRPKTLGMRADALEDCVEKLPAGQRELLLECFDGSKTVAMVAEETGRTTHSVYSSLRHIRGKLLDCVDESVSKSESEGESSSEGGEE
jgi:RNA polymerase sigma-70 factor (ECF subfamily)